MSQFAHSDFPADFRTDFCDELDGVKMEAKSEPLLPIEKKLIGFSFGIGLFLLAMLAVATHFLPAAL